LHRRCESPTLNHLFPILMRPSLLLLALLVACRPAGQPASTSSIDRAALTRQLSAQLDRSAGDWNRGDLDAFMSDYAAESTTTYVDGHRARHGFDFIRNNYAPRFAPGARRDSLHFEELEVRPLSPTLALLTARFILQRGDSTTASGPFTLVMEHRSDGWKILHDHSSSDPH
jgi:ketosteroid isomerase-like protein